MALRAVQWHAAGIPEPQWLGRANVCACHVCIRV
jgi:hypothetical protein